MRTQFMRRSVPMNSRAGRVIPAPGIKIVLICTLLFAAQHAFALQAGGIRKSSAPSWQNARSGLSSAPLNVGDLHFWMQADGISGRPPVVDPENPQPRLGTRYPAQTASVLYQDGILWGAKAWLDSAQSTPAPFEQPVRIGGAWFRTSTRPGRILGAGANAVPQDPSDETARVYRIRREAFFLSDQKLRPDAAELANVPQDSVTAEQIAALRARYAKDWQEWPVESGAPFVDRNENGRFDPPPDFSVTFTPDDLIRGGYDEPGIAGADTETPADQVLWTVYNDLDPDPQLDVFATLPSGLEVQVTLWAYADPPLSGDLLFRRVRLINKGGVEIDSAGTRGALWLSDVYLCQWADPEIGAFSDDLVGCDTTLGLGYGYNGSDRDAAFDEFGLAPAAVGHVLLQGPLVPAPGESGTFDFTDIQDYRNLALSSFTAHVSGDPWSEPRGTYAQQSIGWYRMFQGFTPNVPPNDAEYFPFPDGMEPGPFPLAGDPLTGDGFVDGDAGFWPFQASERRYQLQTGPFALAPGDTQEVVIAVAAALGADRLSSVSLLKTLTREARERYPEAFKPATTTAIAEPTADAVPTRPKIDIFPNPSRDGTHISFSLQNAAPVKLEIFDMLGRRVKRIVDSHLGAGTHSFRWDGRDQSNVAAAAGVYWYRLRTGSRPAAGRILLLR